MNFDLFCLKFGHMLGNFAIFGPFLFSATVLRRLLSRYGFETSSIVFSAVFSIGINRFCQNLFPNKATVIFLKICVGNFFENV